MPSKFLFSIFVIFEEYSVESLIMFAVSDMSKFYEHSQSNVSFKLFMFSPEMESFGNRRQMASPSVSSMTT
jgi:hypothetical protein